MLGKMVYLIDLTLLKKSEILNLKPSLECVDYGT